MVKRLGEKAIFQGGLMTTTLVCYCFQHTEADLEQDVLRNRRSTIMEQIIRESKKGQCQCAVKNPKGR